MNTNGTKAFRLDPDTALWAYADTLRCRNEGTEDHPDVTDPYEPDTPCYNETGQSPLTGPEDRQEETE